MALWPTGTMASPSRLEDQEQQIARCVSESFSVEERQKNVREEAPCSISKHDIILLPVTMTSSLASHLQLLPEMRDLK